MIKSVTIAILHSMWKWRLKSWLYTNVKVFNGFKMSLSHNYAFCDFLHEQPCINTLKRFPFIIISFINNLWYPIMDYVNLIKLKHKTLPFLPFVHHLWRMTYTVTSNCSACYASVVCRNQCGYDIEKYMLIDKSKLCETQKGL